MPHKIITVFNRIKKSVSDACRRLRGDRGKLSRAGYYAALTALLILLGSASHAYRMRSSDVAPSPAPQPKAAAAMNLFADPSPEPTEAPAVWVWPLEGEVIGAYSPQTTVWSSTLGQWQTHPAIDIAGNPGEAVRACADGTVSDAWQDALWGNALRIVHPDGSVSTYANLNTLNMVQVGQAVKAGDIISSVGKSAAYESEMPWHLHFSLEKAGEPVDFEALAPER